MNFLRTDGQAALNSLLKAARETLDHYQDATELVDESHVKLFQYIAQQRHQFIHRLDDAVRASGILPTVPDPDKEAGEMLVRHAAALLTSDYAANVIEQRIDGDNNLADLVTEAKDAEPDAPHASLLNELELHIAETIKRLQAAHAQVTIQGE